MYTDCPGYPKEVKIKILEEFIKLAPDVKKYSNLSKVAAEAGIRACGQPVHVGSIYIWKKDPELHQLISIALVGRAETYIDMAQDVLDNIQEFWDSIYYTNRGEKVIIKKERVSAVNKAKLQLEHYKFYITRFAPEVYGDYYDELKQMDKKLKDMQNQLNAMGEK